MIPATACMSEPGVFARPVVGGATPHVVVLTAIGVHCQLEMWLLWKSGGEKTGIQRVSWCLELEDWAKADVMLVNMEREFMLHPIVQFI